jgi:hypothetical protein
MAAWYVRRGESVIGPIDSAKLSQLVTDGRLLPSDQLAKDAAGPWTEARRTPLFVNAPTELTIESKPASLIPSGESLPAETVDQVGPVKGELVGGSGKTAPVIQASKSIATAFGRGTLATGSAVVRYLSTRSQRRHELKLAKIQAQAMANSQRPQPPAATTPGTPITFTPNIVQTTVVKVVNRNSGGCRKRRSPDISLRDSIIPLESSLRSSRRIRRRTAPIRWPSCKPSRRNWPASSHACRPSPA